MALVFAAATGQETALPEILVWEAKTIGIPDDLKQIVQLSLAHETTKMPGMHAVSAKDLSAALDVQYQKRLLGCSDEACIAEIGGALGIRYVLFAEIVVVESELLMSLRLMDMNNMRVMSTASRRCAFSPEAALAAVSELVQRVFFPDRSGRPWAMASFATGGALGVATVVLAMFWRSATIDYRESVLPQEDLARRARMFSGLTLAGGGLTVLSLAVGTYLQVRYEGTLLQLESRTEAVQP